jgi:hypothetical protein
MLAYPAASCGDRGRIPPGCAIMFGSFLTGKPREAAKASMRVQSFSKEGDMKIRCAFLIGVFTVILMVLSPAAHALTIDNVYLFTNNRGGSGGGMSTGYYLYLDVFASPSGSGTTVTAQQVSGGTNSATFTYSPSPLFPDDYYARFNFNSGLTGQWQVTVVNAGESVSKLSSVLDDVRQLPLAQSLTVSTASGQFTPTISWTGFDSGQFPGFSGTPVDGSDDFSLRVRARYSDGRSMWQSEVLSTSVTSYTIPAGVLASSQNYILEILLNHYDYKSGEWILSNRSENFLSYSTPAAAGLTISNHGAYTINRGGDASAAAYTMEVEAIVTDTGGNQITSVWAYNGSYNYQLTPRNFGSIGTIYYHEETYAGQTGVWEIRATNSLGETVSAYTHNFDKPLQIPPVTGVSFSDQTTSPTVYWNLVPSSAVDNYRVRVTSDGYYTLYQSNLLPSTATSFQIPAGIMSVGTQYIVRIQAFDLDLENGVNYLENRSDNHTYFTPTSVAPIPGDFSGDCDVDGSDLTALIANISWLDIGTFAQNFGKSDCQ